MPASSLQVVVLPAPLGPEITEDLSLLDLQVEVVLGEHAAVRLSQPLGRHGRRLVMASQRRLAHLVTRLVTKQAKLHSLSPMRSRASSPAPLGLHHLARS